MKNSKLILKTKQRFRSETRNVFTEEINNIALTSNDDKTMQSTDFSKTYQYEVNKDLVCKNIIKQYKNVYICLHYEKRHKKHNPNWPEIPDHPYIILIVPDIDKILFIC